MPLSHLIRDYHLLKLYELLSFTFLCCYYIGEMDWEAATQIENRDSKCDRDQARRFPFFVGVKILSTLLSMFEDLFPCLVLS